MLCQPTLRAFFLGAALLVSAAAQADDSSLPWNDEVGQWFVAPFAGYTWVDDDRLLDDDIVYGASVGKHLSDHWTLQLTGYTSEFDNAGAMMSVDDTLMCSFQILKPAEKKVAIYGEAGSTLSAPPSAP